jgi:apolipoprotein N-acyltransferase
VKEGIFMSRDLEGLLFFGVMGLVVVISISVAIIRMKTTKKFGRALAQSIFLSFFLFSLACIWWLYQASDGFSQVFGWLFYGIVFALVCFINTGILFYMRQKA